jgi:hypothetical protein
MAHQMEQFFQFRLKPFWGENPGKGWLSSNVEEEHRRGSPTGPWQ